MGQKTNPTLLRLEKTNQHYKGCWYSDRFYSQLLHGHYKTCVYITKIFHKMQNTNPLFFYKAAHQLNHLFCIFPKNRFSRHKSGKNPRYNYVLEEKGNALSLIYALSKNLSIEKQHRTHRKTTKVVAPLHPWHKKAAPHMPGADSPYGVGPVLWAYLYKTLPMQAAGGWPAGYGSSSTPSVSGFTTISQGSIHRHQEVQHQPSNRTAAKNPLLKQGSTPLWERPSPQRTRDSLPQVKSNHRARMESVIDVFLSKHVYLPSPPYDPQGAKPFNTCRGVENGYFHRPKDFGCNGCFRNTQICFLKVNHNQQNAHFIGEKIASNIKKRLNYQRIRRQILWDVNQCSYIRGIRVTLSGRVATLSKKAQKARTFSFQWGQTEVHVFSSCVQFTKIDVVTTFGKIGVKVWVCYASKEIS